MKILFMMIFCLWANIAHTKEWADLLRFSSECEYGDIIITNQRGTMIGSSACAKYDPVYRVWITWDEDNEGNKFDIQRWGHTYVKLYTMDGELTLKKGTPIIKPY